MDTRALQVGRLVARKLVKNGAEAVALFGSWVRGDAYNESDLDIHAIGRRILYRLERQGGYLVSISLVTVKHEQDVFRKPAEVGGAVPAWRNAMVIYDPKGIAKSLKHEAIEWRWEFVSKQADRWVAEEITGYAEEVHRLVGNLQLARRNAAAVQRSVLAIRMAPILAVYHRILYETENRLWDLVSEKMGKRWAKLQSSALGETDQSFEETCIAAIQLFALAVQEVKHLLNKRQREVVDHACKIAKSFSSQSAQR